VPFLRQKADSDWSDFYANQPVFCQTEIGLRVLDRSSIGDSWPRKCSGDESAQL